MRHFAVFEAAIFAHLGSIDSSGLPRRRIAFVAPPHFAAVDEGSPAAVAGPRISALLGLLLAHHPCGTDSMPSGKLVGRGHR